MTTDSQAPDPIALLRSRSYVQLLLLAAIVGVPVSAIAYGFLELVDALQTGLFTDLPKELGFESAPMLWPVPLLAIGGLLTALSIRLLPGTGGHSPADGFKAGAVTLPTELPGVFFAALATLSFGAVLGPEAPLIALGSGLGMLAVRLAARDAPDMAGAVIAAAGSFAAISTLMGSPLLGAFLLLEAAGLAGPMVGVVLLPGLLAAGIGSLIFIGLDHITGLGTFSLTIPDVPEFGDPTVAMFGWALAFGLVAPFLGHAIRRLALWLRPRVEPRMVLLMPLLGVVVAGLAILFGEVTDKGSSEVLFSGQNAVGPLVSQAATWSTGALLLLIACKSLAYALCLSSFRGGPIFPSIFIGAAAGVAAADLPGMSLVPGVAMGMGAMSAVMLGLPLTSVLLAALLLGTPALNALPLVIVAVVVAHVVSARLTPAPEAPDQARRASSESPEPATTQTRPPPAGSR
jgi:chloride channel protein, CIC family